MKPFLRKVEDDLWEIPVSYKKGMRVPGRIFASVSLIESMDDGVFDQVANVAMLPGIVGYAFCMPDGHYGYGFPIGGVAAFDTREGIISPGGIGFDINCGMRLLKTNLTLSEISGSLVKLVDGLFSAVPAGVGGTGFFSVSRDDFLELVEGGARWIVRRGYGTVDDLTLTEEEGCMEGADAARVSDRAIERGLKQVGTLGSGNHYLEIQVARREDVIDKKTAARFGFTLPDQIAVMFHCGSRGFGHQVASDWLKRFAGEGSVPAADRELACAPFHSELGQGYFNDMKCAANMAYANRQVILHRIREVFSDVLHRSPDDLGMTQVYDVSHNTAKIEEHEYGGTVAEMLVHRKGATRAFGPGMESLPDLYRETGQPVIIGGSMETGSYLLAGTGARAAFCTTAHGSGRTMSRRHARKSFDGKKIINGLERRGIYVRTSSCSGLAEEAGAAYKDIDEIVSVTARAGISRPVIRFTPVGSIKG